MTGTAPTHPAPPRRGLGTRLLAGPDLVPLVVGWVFWLESLRPSLLPRPAVMQGALSAVCLLVGYGIGGLVAGGVRRLLARGSRPAPLAQRTPRRTAVRAVLLVVGVASVPVAAVVWLSWQNDQRSLVAMPHVGPADTLVMLAVTVVLTVVLLVVARLVAALVGWVDRALQRRLAPALAHLLVAAAVVVVAVVLGNKVVIDGVLGSASAAFSAGDSTTEPGVHQPTVASASGGPGSLVPWDTLGLQGRTWVAGVTPTNALAAFAGPGAHVMAPVRAYAGLASAPTPQARADLALADLERAGGFSRRVLVVATATGSGWVNPVMSSALEYQWAGDCAMVSMQYSYLPSWIAFLTDRAQAADAGQVLNRTVYDYWSTLPATHRPLLVFFGESLGSYGSEFGFPGATTAQRVNAVLAGPSSALWVGPTNANPLWSALTAARTPGSPVWRPTYGAGETVLFATGADQFTPATATPRLQYLQHPSDPVTWWNLSTFYRPPPWLRSPLGSDIPRQASWFPIVTFAQVSADLIEGFSTPAGHGHNYNDAWAQALTSVAAPPGWSAADTQRLATAMVALHGLGGNS